VAKEVSCEISIMLNARKKGLREVINEEAIIVEELEASLRELEEQERRILGKFILSRMSPAFAKRREITRDKNRAPSWVFLGEGEGSR